MQDVTISYLVIALHELVSVSAIIFYFLKSDITHSNLFIQTDLLTFTGG